VTDSDRHLPTARDFSEKSVAKVVRDKSVFHPLVLYPGVLSLLGGVSFFLFSSPVLALIALGTFAIGSGTFIVNFFFRRKGIAANYLDEMHERLRQQTEKSLVNLARELKAYGCMKGVDQIKRAKEKYHNFVEILDTQIYKTELTYSRYLGIGEQVYLLILDNLTRITLLLKSMSDDNVNSVSARLKSLGSQLNMTEKQLEEKKILERQLKRLRDQDKFVDNIISTNEIALAKLDETQAAIASIQTKHGRASMEIEDVMSELVRLTEGAEKYDIHR